MSSSSVQERTCEQRLRSQVQGVCENPQQNQCLFQTVALEQMLPILGEKGDDNKTIALEQVLPILGEKGDGNKTSPTQEAGI